MQFRRSTLSLLLLALLVMMAPRPPLASAGPGLSVSPQGVLLKDGRPYRAIGANYFSGFYRHLMNPNDTSYREGFKVLAKHKIPYVRIMAAGFYPLDWKLYREDKAAYLRRLDDVVRAAEENHIGLICSLFFAGVYMPDVVGEPIDQLGNPKSKTWDFMRQYIHDVVPRYQHSPALWGWEFGNEMNHQMDIWGSRTTVLPQMGTAAKRTSRDDLTWTMIHAAFLEFAKEVRKYDPERIIESGNAVPRQSAWHNTHEHSFVPDTRDQYAEMLLRDNPDPMNVISIHLYANGDDMFYADRKVKISELFRETQAMAATVKKPVFLGEFGATASMGPEREGITKLIAAIEANKIPLSAIWDFDGVSHDTQWVKDWRISEDNPRGYMLDLVQQANERIATQLENERKHAKP